MHVLALKIELRLTACRSLKDKRAVLRPIIDGIRNRFTVAVAETDRQDEWQRATIGLAAISNSPGHASEMIDEAERFVWSFPEVEVLETWQRWLEED
ncbi:MAG: DUF503 domain-containing protein [Acidimicrobiaceae bacterium]|jgi:hypothetical protein|nr:DUF503 domain-containing protein [Acidimicrobiaceae bacterium]